MKISRTESSCRDGRNKFRRWRWRWAAATGGGGKERAETVINNSYGDGGVADRRRRCGVGRKRARERRGGELLSCQYNLKLSQTFEDVKAENECLKDNSDGASYLQLDDSDSLKIELSKMKTEIESLISKSNEITSENDKLNQVMSSWTKSSISLGKLHDVQKPFNDRTGLGFSSGESSSSDTSTKSDLANDKLKKMTFVKEGKFILTLLIYSRSCPKKLSQTFEDVKAENECLKDNSDGASYLQLDDSDSLKIELSKMKTEIESLISKSNEITSENDKLNQHDLYADLKAYEFEPETKSEGPSTRGHFAADTKPKNDDKRASDRRRHRFDKKPYVKRGYHNALNDEMIHEYKKLSQTFKDVKAENECLKDNSDGTSHLQLDYSDSLKIELSKMKTEIESLISKSNELTSENDKLNQVMSSWTKSSISLGKLHDVQKPFNDRTGLGFSSGESSSSDTSTKSDLANEKLKKMTFVKSSVIRDTLESVKYDDQNVSKLNHKGKFGIGYAEPEKSKPIWLRNRLDKDRAKFGPHSSDLHQLSQGSRKHKSRPSSPLQAPPQPPAAAAARCRRKFVFGQLDEENPFVLISSALLVQPDEGVSFLVVDRIGDYLPQSTEKSRILVIPVGARHKCQQACVKLEVDRETSPLCSLLVIIVEDERVTPVYLISLLGSVTTVTQLVGELTLLEVPQEVMPPRRMGRGRGQFQDESEGQNEEMQRSVPRRGRDRQVEVELSGAYKSWKQIWRVGDFPWELIRCSSLGKCKDPTLCFV
ncbi:hypothetical protein F511_35424 [Dorcoceras hygrometricum]|uniref:Uncharacterized protein n=1 Tax=Dorcoceras hygrometricum TaxID=472368 RepID=A0A2Z7D3N5_9LAMI|nr:hypothetical protein F511_35424 [Dorcoceras hygrometricum]